jgi:acyl-CoA synthetase (AMP-forming)/AMP-acid ligase II
LARLPALKEFCVVAALNAGAASDESAFEFVRWRGEEEMVQLWSREDLLSVVRAEAALIAGRTKPGDRVVVAHPPGPAFVAAFLACLASGRIAVPAAAPLTAASRAAVERLAAATDATLVLTRGDSPAEMPGVRADAIIDAPRDEDIAYVQFTSGSTEAPRGAVITHGALRANIAAIGDAWALTSSDHGAFWLPPFHDMGLVGAILAPLAFGVPSTLMHPAAFLQRPVRWLDLMSSRRATFSGGPNFAYDLATDRAARADTADLDLSSWRVAVNGAEPVRRRTLRRFAERFAGNGFRADAFAPGYGLAESVLFVSARRADDPPVDLRADDDAPVDCGPPGRGADIRIVDEAANAVVADGVAAAIWVTGPSLAAGYWNAPDDSAAHFGGVLDGDDRRWLRTGDIGFLRDRRLHVCGRAKDVLIRGGRKTHAADVEAIVVRALGMRAACAAFAVADGAGNEDIVIIVEHATAAPDAVLAKLRDAVAAAFDLTPDVIALCAPGAVRLTTSGKTARAATRDAWRANNLPIRAVWRRPVSAAA